MKGSHDMINYAGKRLHLLAFDLVLPLRSVLSTREPTTVAAALAIMKHILTADTEVGKIAGLSLLVPQERSCAVRHAQRRAHHVDRAPSLLIYTVKMCEGRDSQNNSKPAMISARSGRCLLTHQLVTLTGSQNVDYLLQTVRRRA